MEFHQDLKVFEQFRVTLKWLVYFREISRIQFCYIRVIGSLPYRHIQCWQKRLAVIAREAIQRVISLGCVEGVQSGTVKILRQIVACNDIWQDRVVETKYLDCESANRGWVGSRRNDTTRDVIWPADKKFQLLCIERG